MIKKVDVKFYQATTFTGETPSIYLNFLCINEMGK